MSLAKYKVLDLFSGCGGLSQGFSDAGFNVVLGADYDLPSLNTFSLNHRESYAVHTDLSNPTFLGDIDTVLKGEEIDVVIGGPPCQGFSLTGSRDRSDHRNSLHKAMEIALEKYSPKILLLENVKGLMSLYKGEMFNLIIDGFARQGYEVSHKLLNAADYGVPQNRERVFIVAHMKGMEFSFPDPTHSIDTFVGCEEAIGDLPGREFSLGEELDSYDSPPTNDYQVKMRDDSRDLHNHVATNHTDAVKWVISFVPEGGNHKDLPRGVGESRKFNEAWTRYHSREPARTIDTGHRNHFHYKYNRVPTIRENARLQSFKDTFVFCGTRTQQNKQVGNAVPPLLAYHMAKQVKAAL